MGKEQICPFSLRLELIGIWNSVQRGTPPLPERLKGTVDNLRSTKREVQDQLAYSSFEYQEGVDRRGRPDLIHPRFGSMTDSLLRFVAIQNSPEGRNVAKTQLRQWLLIKEAALDLKEGEEIYALVPKMIEIEDGAALMRLRKDGDRFLAQSRLLPQDFDQEKAHLLFGKFKEKGLKMKDLIEDEPSLIFRIAKGEKENSVDLKDTLPQILTELSRPVLAKGFQESQIIPRPLAEFSPSISFSLFELILPREDVVVSPQSKEASQEKVVFVVPNFLEKPQIDKVHNLQRSQENVQPRIIEKDVFVRKNSSVEENEENSVNEEQTEIFIEKERQPFLASLGGQISLDTKQQKMVVETVDQLTTRKETATEVSIYVHPGGVDRKEVESSVAVERLSEDLQLKESVERETVMTEREEVVVFEAAEPVTELVTSVSEPFAFIRNEPRIEEKMVPEITTLQLLQQVEEAVLPVLIVPSFEQAEQTVYIEEEISQSIIPRILPRRHKNGVVPHGEVIEKEIPGQEEQKEITENREERIVLPKVEVWTPRIVSLNFSLLQWRESKQQFVDLSTNLISEKFLGRVLELGKKNPNWIELLSPKEISIITAMARDKFGHRPFSSTTLADLALFWLAAMSLLAQKPILYKLELDFTPLTVNVKDGKILVARKAIPEEGLGRESLWAEWRQSLPRPFLSLTA